jgi:four helix bundle protein
MQFKAYELSLSYIRALRDPIQQIRLHSPDEADQLQRAANSIARNINEGSGRFGRDRRQLRRQAYGSLQESIASLDIAAANGWLEAQVPARAIGNELGAMLWPLVKP